MALMASRPSDAYVYASASALRRSARHYDRAGTDDSAQLPVGNVWICRHQALTGNRESLRMACAHQVREDVPCCDVTALLARCSRSTNREAREFMRCHKNSAATWQSSWKTMLCLHCCKSSQWCTGDSSSPWMTRDIRVGREKVGDTLGGKCGVQSARCFSRSEERGSVVEERVQGMWIATRCGAGRNPWGRKTTRLRAASIAPTVEPELTSLFDQVERQHVDATWKSLDARMMWRVKGSGDDVAEAQNWNLTVKGVEVAVVVRLHGKLIRQKRLKQCLEMMESFLEEKDSGIALMNALLPHHREFLDSCTKPEHLQLAFNYVDLFPTNAQQLIAPLIAACGRAQRVDKIADALDMQRTAALDLRAPLIEDPYAEAILGAGKLGEMRLAEEFFQRAQTDDVCGTACWNALIESWSRCGDAEEALAMFSRMKDCSVLPDFNTFQILLRGLRGRGNIAQADGIYKDLKQSGLVPSTYTFTLLFGVAKAALDKGARDKALHKVGTTIWEWHKEMEDFGLIHNAYTLSALMSVLARIGSMRQVAFDAFHEARSDGQHLNTSAYSAMIYLCAQAGMIDKAFDLYRSLRDAGSEPMAFAVAAVIAACKKGSRLDRAFEFYRELMKNPNSTALLGGGPGQPPGITVIRNSLINVCKECAQVDLAFEVFEEMKKDEVNPPDGVTYGTLITACGQAHQVERAFGLLEEMRSRGIAPLGPVFTALMTACLRAERPADAFVVFEEMKIAKKPPTQVTFGCLLTACYELNDVKRAFEVYEEMLKMKVQPNDACHNILIRLCSKAGQVDQALEKVKQLLRNKGNVTVGTFNSVLRALCQTHVDRAVRFFSLMQTMNIAPDQGSFVALVEGCARDNQALKGYDVSEEMLRRGMVVERNSSSELISSLCRAGELQLALRVRETMMAGDVVPHQAALCDLISLCSRGGRRPQKALELYDDFKRQAAIPPDTMSFSVADTRSKAAGNMRREGRRGRSRLRKEAGFSYGHNTSASGSTSQHMTALTSTACEALIEACCMRGQIEEGMAIFQDAQAGGIHLNTATLAYLVNVITREKATGSFYIYAVTAQLRKELARRKMMKIDMESKQAAEYKQAHFRTSANYKEYEGQPDNEGAYENDEDEFEDEDEDEDEEEEEEEEENGKPRVKTVTAESRGWERGQGHCIPAVDSSGSLWKNQSAKVRRQRGRGGSDEDSGHSF